MNKNIINGTKKCSKCNLIKDVCEFHTNKGVYIARCKTCTKQDQSHKYKSFEKVQQISQKKKETYQLQKNTIKIPLIINNIEIYLLFSPADNWSLKRNYNIDIYEYSKMVEMQDNKCAICKQSETMLKNGTIKKLDVDHNHETGEVRGLLCANCNLLLGKAKDNIKILQDAIIYLESNKKDCTFVENI